MMMMMMIIIIIIIIINTKEQFVILSLDELKAIAKKRHLTLCLSLSL